MPKGHQRIHFHNRRCFVGGSDAPIIMGSDESALLRLWREKRGETEPEDLSGNLIVQLGSATEELNRTWYERNTGRRISDVQRHVKHSAIPWMAATLDGIVEGTEAVFEAKFMLPSAPQFLLGKNERALMKIFRRKGRKIRLLR